MTVLYVLGVYDHHHDFSQIIKVFSNKSRAVELRDKWKLKKHKWMSGTSREIVVKEKKVTIDIPENQPYVWAVLVPLEHVEHTPLFLNVYGTQAEALLKAEKAVVKSEAFDYKNPYDSRPWPPSPSEFVFRVKISRGD